MALSPFFFSVLGGAERQTELEYVSLQSRVNVSWVERRERLSRSESLNGFRVFNTCAVSRIFDLSRTHQILLTLAWVLRYDIEIARNWIKYSEGRVGKEMIRR